MLTCVSFWTHQWKSTCTRTCPCVCMRKQMLLGTHCYLATCSIKRGACFIPPLTHATVFGRDLLTEALPACPATCLVDRPPSHPALSRLVCSCLQDAPLCKPLSLLTSYLWSWVFFKLCIFCFFKELWAFELESKYFPSGEGTGGLFAKEATNNVGSPCEIRSRLLLKYTSAKL